MNDHVDELFGGYPERLTVLDLTTIFGVKKSTIYKWLHEGTIPAYQLGTTWIVIRDEVKERMLSGSNLPAPDDAREPGPSREPNET